MNIMKTKMGYVVAVVGFACALWLFVTAVPYKQVVAIGEYAVMYDDNTAEFVYPDYSDNKLHIYREVIQPWYKNTDDYPEFVRVPSHYVLPSIRFQEASRDWVAFIYDAEPRRGEGSRVIYIDRTTKTSHQYTSLLNVTKILNRTDSEYYWGMRQNFDTATFDIGVGAYKDGIYLASTTVKIPVWSDGTSTIGSYYIDPRTVVANSDLTQVVFAFTAASECGDFRGVCESPAFIYQYDIKKNKLFDITPKDLKITERTLIIREDMSSRLHYVRDDQSPYFERFVILNEDGYTVYAALEEIQ